MFTRSDISTIAKRANALTEGSGDGHTVYAEYAPRARYVIGGYHTRLYPVGVAVGRVREDALADMRDPRTYGAQTLGVWEDGGTVYLDYGTVADDLKFALALARKRGELAIWDTRESRAIRLCTAEGVYSHGEHLTALPASQTRPVSYCPECYGEGYLPVNAA